MENSLFIFWMILIVSLVGLRTGAKIYRQGGRNWAIVHSFILGVDVVGWFMDSPTLIYTAGGLWFVFVLIPSQLFRWYEHLNAQQRYKEVRRVARVLSLLYPSPAWKQQFEILRAMELAQQGELHQALEILRSLQQGDPVLSTAAMINYFRLTQQWGEFRRWEEQHPDLLSREPYIVSIMLRARGETEDTAAMIAFYVQQKDLINRLNPPSQRDTCRLFLFAFSGRRTQVEQLFRQRMATTPAKYQEFWLATADLNAGQPEAARQRLEQLLDQADPPLRSAISHRLSQVERPPAVLDEAQERILDSASTELDQDERFESRPPFFSRQTAGAQLFVLLNLIMFGAQMVLGGSTDMGTLYRLGALHAPAVHEGEWWRLVASVFLHFGALHLCMNMFGVYVLAPFVELALGFWRFLLFTLLAGVGSMWFVFYFTAGGGEHQLAVGASGAVMGFMGAMAALMLKGWLRERAVLARKKLLTLLGVAGMQFLIDSMVPQISLTAHLSGLIIGFLLALILERKPKPAALPKT